MVRAASRADASQPDCSDTAMDRRGKPVKRMRLIPAEKAFALARRLQGTPGVLPEGHVHG